MSAYKFQLRFRLPATSLIAGQTNSIRLTIPGNNWEVTIQARGANNLTEAGLFDATGNDFPSKELAIICGRQTRDTISICCALLGLGVGIEKHEEFLDETHVINSTLNEQTYIQPQDVDGLLVYPQKAKIEYLGITATAKGGPSAEKFQEVFSRSYVLSKNLDDKLALALEIYNLHRFESSLRARFLQLISVVECLIARKRQKAQVIEYIDKLISQSKEQTVHPQNFTAQDITNLVNGLNNLKSESISSACQGLINKHLSEKDAGLFKRCYDVRSKLSHEGKIPPELDLIDYYSELKDIVARLFLSILSKQETSI